MRLYLVGNSTLLLEIPGGPTILFDPWFDASLWRTRPLPLRPDRVEKCDLMLVSHGHVDHFGPAACGLARRLGSTLVGPPSVARRARAAGVESVTALQPGESKELQGVTVTATPAEHPLAPDPVGFLVDAGKDRIYFSGDTRRHAALEAFLREHRPLDLMLLQSAHLRLFKDGMDWRDAAGLAADLNPRVAVPIHYQCRGKTRFDPDGFSARVSGAGVKPVVLPIGSWAEVLD